MLGTYCLLSVILVASQPIAWGHAPREPATSSPPVQTRPPSELPSKDERQVRNIERQKLENLARVRGFADHIQGFKSLTPRVRGLIALADVLWKYDEPYARKLFSTAYDAALANPEAGRTSNDTAEQGDSSSQDSGWLRREVVARIARHDAAWARDLTNREAAASKRGVAIGMAWNLLQDDPKQATQYLEMVLDSGPDQAEIAYLLGILRAKDPIAADQWFLKLLQSLSAKPDVDPYEVLGAGGYVLLQNQSDDPVILMGLPVFNSSEINPLASQIAIRAYFDVAAAILSRPVSPSLAPNSVTYFKGRTYVVACLLLPGARQFVPKKAPLIEAAIRNVVGDIPSGLIDDVRANLDPAPPPRMNTIEDARRGLDDIPDDDRHDSRCIDLSYSFLHKEDFQAAKAIAGEVRNLQTREKLQTLLGFEEAVKLLERGKLNDAAAMATKLSPGIERALLWLAIAHKQLESGNAKLAGTTITWALDEANRIQDPRRAVLILGAAADLAGFDPLLARQTFTEAIHTFNRVSPYTPLRMDWSEFVSSRILVKFSLRAGGLDFQLARMLAPLAKIDMEGTIFEVMSLEDEDARGQGLVALASFMLERKATDIRGHAGSNQTEKE